MIETYSELKSWFFCHKVPKGINELAFKAWEDALTDPSLGKNLEVLCLDRHDDRRVICMGIDC